MKKRISLLLIILLAVVAIPVFAEGENGFHAGDKVSLGDALDTSSFVAGNSIDMSSEIDGLNFVAGNNISLSSKQDHLFVAGNNITLNEVVTKDAFLAGSTVTVNSSTIRDLYVAAQTVKINSNIYRNAYVGGDKVIINTTIEGNVKIAADDITIGEEAVIHGTLTYPDKAKIDISESAVVTETKTYETKEVETEQTLVSKIKSAITSFLSLLLIAVILLAINKKFFKRIDEEDKTAAYIFKTVFIGFGFLVLLPLSAIFIMITVIGIPLSIISLILYGIFIYLSMIPTSYYVGKWVLGKTIKNEYLLLASSLLAVYVLKLVPFIGGYIGFISLLLGLGIFFNIMKNSITEDKKK